MNTRPQNGSFGSGFRFSSFPVFGFVPIGLAYHAAYTVLAALLMWLLVSMAWPSRLEQEADEREDGVVEPGPPGTRS